MKKLIYGIVAVAFILIGACNNQKDNSEKKSDNNLNIESSKIATNDTADIRSVILEFYNWYNTNYEKFQDYNLYSGLKKKDVPPYKINWEEVKKYQDFIKSSVPNLGEEFLTDQLAFFKQCDSAFKVDVNDEIPYGFDYDWYTNSQEDPQYLLDEINKKENKWQINVNGNIATVKVNDNQNKDYAILTMLLKKENDKWLIVKIGNE
ncbi:MAG: hypothetical protein KBF82_12255 [Chitinophagaceae bacterium]|nr:hypothetical protein [Chitinophagaceae bacterium]